MLRQTALTMMSEGKGGGGLAGVRVHAFTETGPMIGGGLAGVRVHAFTETGPMI